MSLRDALIAKGVVNKKDARRVERELKDQRKADQGNRERKSKLEAEARAAAQAELERLKAERQAARKQAEDERSRHERALQVRQIILGNRTKNTGPHGFFFRDRDGRTVHRMGVHRKIADALRDGKLGIAAFDHGNHTEYVLIRGSAAERLAELAPEVLVHWATGPVEVGDGVYERDWEPTIPTPGGAPRRAERS